MSVDYSASAAIGLRVTKAQLYPEKWVPGCSHQQPQNIKFCPECGKKTWILSREPIDPSLEAYRPTLDGFPVVWGTNREIGVVALYVALEDDYDQAKNRQAIPDNLVEAKQRLKEAMTRRGLWQDDNYGLVCLLYCSC